jgi:tungstate transport system substrate-binding protein
MLATRGEPWFRGELFSTRDLLMMAALAALGGVVSAYINAVGDFWSAPTAPPIAGSSSSNRFRSINKETGGEMFKRTLMLFAVLALLAGLLAGCGAAQPTAVPEAPQPTAAAPEPTPAAPEPTEPGAQAGGTSLLLSTTTSTEDSGLLGYILPDFEAEYGVTVQVVAVGTGQSLEIGSKGDADVVLVHARAREDEFMAAGHGVRREDVMYNDFVILGPAGDPAGIKGMSNAAEAMAQIAEAEAPFVSRGDDSGTHTKELSVWKAAGIEPAGAWYISAGQGMGAVLTMADEQQAYTLSDRATYLARTLTGLDLELLVEGDPVLFNPYGVMAVNPDKGPHIKADLANQFIDWLISVPVQEKIGQFGVEEFGAPLFVPDSVLYREAHPAGSGGAG